LVALSGFPVLDELELADTGISDIGVRHLHDCRRLETLNLSKTAVTPVAERALQAALPRLRIQR
jgi:hypothetical protein